MIRRQRRALIAACDHHWHPTERGWECCACPDRVKASDAAPEAGAAACVLPVDGDLAPITAWLAPEAPPGKPLGHRPGRRNYHRRLPA